jgi:hypothetical protein
MIMVVLRANIPYLYLERQLLQGMEYHKLFPDYLFRGKRKRKSQYFRR